MSASREKARRRETGTETPEKKNDRAKRQTSYIARQRRQRVINICVVCVLVVAAVLLLFNSTLLYRSNTAVVIADAKYSVVEFNYYYRNAYDTLYNNLYNSLYSSLGSEDYAKAYMSMYIDTSVSLKDQMYDEEHTWDEMVEESALSTMQDCAALSDEAMAAGFALTEEQQEEVGAYKSNLDYYAAYNGVTVGDFLVSYYGRGMNEATYLQLAERDYYVQAYAQEVYAGFTFTTDELEAHYAENLNSFDTVDFRYYYISGAADTEAGIDSDTAMAQAKALAETMAAASSGDVFAELAYTYAAEGSKSSYEDTDATLQKNVFYTSVSSTSYGDWLFDSSRRYGDAEMFESSTGYYVIFFEARGNIRYMLRDVRHILIAPETDTDTGETTDAARAAALEEAEAILAEWLEGGATEESFASLANTYSADGDGTTGGLYENVYLNQMVSEFNDWLFDASREAGDYEIVETTYGYHIMYYVGEGDNYWNLSVDEAVRTLRYTDYVEALTESYQITTRGFGMWFKLKLPQGV